MYICKLEQKQLLMNKNIKKDKILITLIIVLIFSGSFGIRCARPSMPMGGPKDTIPPIAIKISPANFQTRIEPREITMTFNEFMQLKEPQTGIIFSPPMEVKPIVEVRGKTIITTYPHDYVFDTTKTYIIDYGSSVADNNEGNAARKMKYVFSPGSYIDSLAMSGQAIDAKTGDTLINASAFLFDPISDTLTIDSTLFNGDALFTTKTDSLGVYFANHLKAKGYRVYVVEDLNNNGIYDVGEERVGFIDSALNPSKLKDFDIWFDPISRQEYASPQVHFRMFKEVAYTRQKLDEVTILENYKILFQFASAGVEVDTLVINSVPEEAMIKMYSRNRDSLVVWFKSKDFLIPDTVEGYVRYMGIDTLNKKAFVNSDFIVAARKLSGDDIADRKEEKKSLERKGKPTLWERFLQWIRFRYNKNIKKANELATIERLRVYDSLKNNPEALLKLKMDSIKMDSIRIDSLKIDSIRLDSIAQFKIDSANILKIFIEPMQNYNPNKKIYITTAYPLDKLEMDSITLYKYSADRGGGDDYFDESQAAKGETKKKKTIEKVTFEKDSLDFTKYRILADWVEDAEYEFEISPKAMIDIIGASNDTIIHIFKTVESRKSSSLVIDVKDVDGCYFMELVLDGGKIEYKHIITKDSIFTAELLPVGLYKIKITKDDNCNGEFDDGNLTHRIMPESIMFYLNEKGDPNIQLKENFEFNISMSLKEVFNPEYKEQKRVERLLLEIMEQEAVAVEGLADIAGEGSNQKEIMSEVRKTDKIARDANKMTEEKKNIKQKTKL